VSLEGKLFTALTGLVGGRVYPDVAPTGAVTPFLVYQQVGGAAPTYVENDTPNIRNARLQVAVWADTRLAASSLALQVEATLKASTALQSDPIGAFVSDYENDTRLFGTRQDFSIWDAR
jgi:hypothetical protein